MCLKFLLGNQEVIVHSKNLPINLIDPVVLVFYIPNELCNSIIKKNTV